MNLAQKIQSALSFLVDSLSVRFLVGFLVKVNTWVSVALHHLHIFSEDGNSGRQSTSFLYSVSCVPLIHPTTANHGFLKMTGL